jgi:hypothetical protein
MGVVLGLVGSECCPWWVSCLGPFTWRCFASKGPRLPLVRVRFLFVLIHFGVGWFGLLSPKKKKKEKTLH